MTNEAAEYVKFLEAELRGHDLLLVVRPLGKFPKYFIGIHQRTRRPILTFSAALARRFDFDSEVGIANKYLEFLAEQFGRNDVFYSKRKKVSDAKRAGIARPVIPASRFFNGT